MSRESNSPPKTVGERIRALRKRKRIRQKQLAKIVGISPGALTNFEKGRRRISLDWQFADQTLLGGFVGLELAARELPLAFQVRTGFAASDQNLSVDRHDTGRDDYRSTFGHSSCLGT